MVDVRAPRRFVGRPIVREDDRGRVDVRQNRSTKRSATSGGDHAGTNSSAALDHAQHGWLGLTPSGGLEGPTSFAAPRGLVDLYVAPQRLVVQIVHQLGADLLHDPMCGLVAHAKLTL